MNSRDPASAWLAFGLMLAVPTLLPFSRAAEAPILLGAGLGVAALWQRALVLQSTATRMLCIGLGAYVLAALLSAVDAVAMEKSWSTALGALRFVAFGVGVLALLDHALRAGMPAARLSRALGVAAALPILAWVLDGLVQASTGWSLGGSLDADRLSGIFGADDLKLGPLLPPLAPLLLWPLMRGARIWLALTWLAVLIVVLMAGARAGWLSFILVSALLAWRLARGSWWAMARFAGIALLATLLFAAFAYQHSSNFRARVDRTLAASEGQVDVALAGRVPIWRTATAMAAAHPVNGVGVRGFRYAYPDYAAADDPWVNKQTGTGALHGHQIILELLTETGLLGLSLWMVAAILLWRYARRAAPSSDVAFAPWCALAVLVFPVNTHLAFYSSFLGIVLAWLLTMACAQGLLIDRQRL